MRRSLGLGLVSFLAYAWLALGDTRVAAAADGAPAERVVEMNRAALAAFKAGDHEKAKALLMDAVVLGKESGLGTHAAMARTYVHLGVIHVDGLKDTEKAARFFGMAVRIRADIEMTPNLGSKAAAQALADARSGKAAPAAGTPAAPAAAPAETPAAAPPAPATAPAAKPDAAPAEPPPPAPAADELPAAPPISAKAAEKDKALRTANESLARELSDARKQLADAKQRGDKQQADAAKQLADARKQTADAKKQVADAVERERKEREARERAEKERLDAAARLADASKQQFETAKQLAEANKQLADAKVALDKAKNDAAKQAADAAKQLAELKERLEKERQVILAREREEREHEAQDNRERQERADGPDLPSVIPSAIHCPGLDEATLGRELFVHCAAQAGAKAKALVFHYRTGGQAHYNTLVMLPSKKGWHTAEIPAGRLTGKQLHYFVEARDAGDDVLATDGKSTSPNIIMLTAPAVAAKGGTAATGKARTAPARGAGKTRRR